MSPTWLWLKIRKKWKPAYRRSLLSIRKQVSDPVSRKKLNLWYNKMNRENKALFHRLYGRMFQNVQYEIREGEWEVDFAGKSVRLPLRNKSLWLDWDLAIATAGHDAEVKTTYENLLISGKIKVVFDIGANYGTHSLLFLAHGIKTYSFEPIPALKKDFEYLCNINQFQGQMENVAVGEKSGTATLTIPVNETWNSVISDSANIPSKDSNHFEKIQVPVITVDEFVATSGMSPDFIKIDTEGYEINVLQGAVKTILKKRPLIIFETNKFRERKILWDFFIGVKYKIHELPFHPEQKKNNFTVEQFFKKGATNYIAVPDAGF